MINQIGVFELKGKFILVSGINTAHLLLQNGIKSVKVRVYGKASNQETTVLALHDLLTLHIYKQMSANAKKRIFNDILNYIRNDRWVAEAFKCIDARLNCFSAIVSFYAPSYRSSFYLKKQKNKNSDAVFCINAQWYNIDAEKIYFERKQNKIVNIYAESGVITQKLIFEQTRNGLLNIFNDYSSNRDILCSCIATFSEIFIAESADNLLVFNRQQLSASIYSSKQKNVLHYRLFIRTIGNDYELTYNGNLVFRINHSSSNQFSVERIGTKKLEKMRVLNFAVLPHVQ